VNAVNVGSFAHPEWWSSLIWGLLAITLALVVARVRARARRRRLAGMQPRTDRATWRSDAALLVALTCIAAALLGPRIGERVVSLTANGVDVVILVDVSRSMDAQDTPPSRLDRAKRAVEELLARLEPHDRAALAAFAGRGVVLAPLTPDHGALRELLAALDTDLIAPASSNLTAGLDAALRAFEPGSPRPRVVLLASDGEDPQRRPAPSPIAARRADVRIVALAFGSERGSAVPDYGVALRDLAGQVVVSRRDVVALDALARGTEGALLAADEWGEVDADAVATAVRRDAGAVAGQSIERRIPAVRIAPFIVVALVLLMAEGLPRPRRLARPEALVAVCTLFALPLLGAAGEGSAGRPARFLRVAGAATGPVSGAAATGPLEAALRRTPGDPAILFELGRARLVHGDPSGASRAFFAAALAGASAESISEAHFALGVSELERNRLGRARDAFLDALAFDPDHERARFNLEWTLLALGSESAPEPPARPKPNPGSSQIGSEPIEPEPDPEPDAAPPGVSEPRPAAEKSAAPQLERAELLRSLARVRDDLGRALQAAVQDEARTGDAPERPAGPVW
jgi:Ca-activated chloride channel family protein